MSEKLSADVLGLIFEYVVLSNVDRRDQCAAGDRPFFFVLSGPDAVAIRSTCVRWRDIFLHRVLLPGVAGAKAVSRYCLTPECCAQVYQERIVQRLRTTRPIFHVVRLNAINFELELYHSDTDSSFIDDESITEDSDEYELAAYWEVQWECPVDIVE